MRIPWFSSKKKRKTDQAEAIRPVEALGRWASCQLPDRDEPVIGFVYYDSEAGLSLRHTDDTSTFTVRLPMGPLKILSDQDVASRGLESTPDWVEEFYGDQKLDAPWRKDLALTQAAHESFPDDVLVTLHDGEPRRTEIGPEHCWVRISGSFEGPVRQFMLMPDTAPTTNTELLGNTVYVGELQNEPHHLTTVTKGDNVHFLADSGSGKALMVTDEYLKERPDWWIVPCDKCGFAEGYDAPSLMHQTRFPETPEDATPEQFTAFCPECGGMQMFSRDGTGD